MKKDAPRCSEDSETGYPNSKELGKERAGQLLEGCAAECIWCTSD